MLVLTLKEGQSIRVGDVLVKAVRVGESVVKVGVEAPRDVMVCRAEMADERKGAQRAKK